MFMETYNSDKTMTHHMTFCSFVLWPVRILILHILRWENVEVSLSGEDQIHSSKDQI